MSEELDVQIDGPVATLQIRRGPHNFFDIASLQELVDGLVALDAEPTVRCVVLASAGRNFCAGADLRGMDSQLIRRVYRTAAGLFTTSKPIVAAVHGATVGGGLGLALAADFRIAGTDARFTANFARLGFHHGFGLTATLPALVGQQRALELLYSGRTVGAPEALKIGLCDQVADDPRVVAVRFAAEIAQSAPLSLTSIRRTMRRALASHVVAALDIEATAQSALLGTADFAEGVAASVQKRMPVFTGS